MYLLTTVRDLLSFRRATRAAVTRPQVPLNLSGADGTARAPSIRRRPPAMRARPLIRPGPSTSRAPLDPAGVDGVVPRVARQAFEPGSPEAKMRPASSTTIGTTPSPPQSSLSAHPSERLYPRAPLPSGRKRTVSRSRARCTRTSGSLSGVPARL